MGTDGKEKKSLISYQWDLSHRLSCFLRCFIIVPTIASVYYSFTSWDGLNPVVKFVGLANYKEILPAPVFGNALKNTVILTAFISILENSMALIPGADRG